MSVRAGILVTGTEVITARITDRNGPWISQRLGELGVEVAHILTVGDRPEDLEGGLRFMAGEGCDLIVTSGGLGPTADDLTAAFGGRVVRVSSPQGRFGAEAALLDGSTLLRADAAGKHLFVELDGGDEEVASAREVFGWESVTAFEAVTAAEARTQLWDARHNAAFAVAAAAFTCASAWTWRGWRVSPLIGKFSIARCVWARHRASRGTSTSPMESCSVRVSLMP